MGQILDLARLPFRRKRNRRLAGILRCFDGSEADRIGCRTPELSTERFRTRVCALPHWRKRLIECAMASAHVATKATEVRKEEPKALATRCVEGRRRFRVVHCSETEISSRSAYFPALFRSPRPPISFSPSATLWLTSTACVVLSIQGRFWSYSPTHAIIRRTALNKAEQFCGTEPFALPMFEPLIGRRTSAHSTSTRHETYDCTSIVCFDDRPLRLGRPGLSADLPTCTTALSIRSAPPACDRATLRPLRGMILQ